MPDARFPDRWLNDRRIRRLSAAEFRAFVVSLAWSVSNRTDGIVDPGDVGLIPDFSTDAIAGLVANGVWVGSGPWTIVDFNDTQSTAAQMDGLARRRFNDRERQARSRAKKATPKPSSRERSRDDPHDASIATQRQGQGRPRFEDGAVDVDGWAEGYGPCSVDGCTDRQTSPAGRRAGLCPRHMPRQGAAA